MTSEGIVNFLGDPGPPCLGFEAVPPGMVRRQPGFFDQLYTYAWFVTFGLAFCLYLLLMILLPAGGNAEHEAFESTRIITNRTAR